LISDYAKHGQGADRFNSFARDLRWQPGNQTHEPIHYTQRTLNSGMCGYDSNMVTNGGCTSEVMTDFFSCASNHRLTEFGQAVPFFHSMFARPSQRLSDLVRRVRSRLGLPMNIADEPIPGRVLIFSFSAGSFSVNIEVEDIHFVLFVCDGFS
jgi:hypothetical protein